MWPTLSIQQAKQPSNGIEITFCASITSQVLQKYQVLQQEPPSIALSRPEPELHNRLVASFRVLGLLRKIHQARRCRTSPSALWRLCYDQHLQNHLWHLCLWWGKKICHCSDLGEKYSITKYKHTSCSDDNIISTGMLIQIWCHIVYLQTIVCHFKAISECILSKKIR